MNRFVPERVGQVFVDKRDVLLVIGNGVYPGDQSVPAWTLPSLENGQLYILSEDWVLVQEKLGNLMTS